MSISRAIAVCIIAVGALTGLHFIATVIYHDGSPEYPLWEAWNWVMAVAFVPMIAFTLRDKMAMQRDSDGADGPVTRRYLETNVLFYAVAGLAISFFWNWLWGSIQAARASGRRRGTCRYGRFSSPSTLR